jgi:hypothetical protein
LTGQTAFRLVREGDRAMAECSSCGARMTVGAEGAGWTVRQPSDVGDRLILQLGGLEREELWVLLLNAKNVVTGQERVYAGNVSASLVRVGELFTEAVRRNASRIILAHNHPSGDVTPSPDDLHLTAVAVQAGRLLDIEVLDHLVVGAATFVSLRDRGMNFDRPWPAALPIGPAGTRSPGRVDRGHEVGEAEFERSGNAIDVDQRDVSLAALNVPHVGSVHPGPLGKSFLRQAAVQPKPPDPVSEGEEDFASVAGHGTTLSSCLL